MTSSYPDATVNFTISLLLRIIFLSIPNSTPITIRYIHVCFLYFHNLYFDFMTFSLCSNWFIILSLSVFRFHSNVYSFFCLIVFIL